MRLPGYCERCHRFRQVRVTAPPLSGVATGVCDECDDER